jgi:beta-mannosidase
MDGWPQFSDAIVDYYFRKKLAYDFIRVSQQPLCLMLREPENWQQELVACNDTREDMALEYAVSDADSAEVVAAGKAIAQGDAVTVLGRLPFSMGEKRFYLLEWKTTSGRGRNHYLAGNPPFDLETYRGWLRRLREG